MDTITATTAEILAESEALVDLVLGCPTLRKQPERAVLREARADCEIADRVNDGDAEAEVIEAELGGPSARAERQYRLQRNSATGLLCGVIPVGALRCGALCTLRLHGQRVGLAEIVIIAALLKHQSVPALRELDLSDTLVACVP